MLIKNTKKNKDRIGLFGSILFIYKEGRSTPSYRLQSKCSAHSVSSQTCETGQTTAYGIE